MNKLTDNEIIENISKGEANYISEIYKRYLRKVTKKVREKQRDAWGRNQQRPNEFDIADIVQECFIKVYKRAKTIHTAINIKERIPFEPYFMQLVKNSIKDFNEAHLRKIKNEVKIPELDDIKFVTGRETTELDHEQLEHYIKKLKKRQRIVLWLRYIKGLKSTQIAKKLKIKSVETIRSRLKRGNKKLFELHQKLPRTNK